MFGKKMDFLEKGNFGVSVHGTLKAMNSYEL